MKIFTEKVKFRDIDLDPNNDNKIFQLLSRFEDGSCVISKITKDLEIVNSKFGTNLNIGVRNIKTHANVNTGTLKYSEYVDLLSGKFVPSYVLDSETYLINSKIDVEKLLYDINKDFEKMRSNDNAEEYFENDWCIVDYGSGDHWSDLSFSEYQEAENKICKCESLLDISWLDIVYNKMSKAAWIHI